MNVRQWLRKLLGMIPSEAPNTTETDLEDTDFLVALRELSWYIKDKKVVEGKAIGWQSSHVFQQTFPMVHQLLSRARVTELEIDEYPYRLYAWDTKTDATCGWLCRMEKDIDTDLPLIEEHLLFCDEVGGLEESWDEFDELESTDGYSIAMNFMFTVSRCSAGMGSFEEPYLLACTQQGLTPLPYYEELITFAKEGNGDRRTYAPATGNVLLLLHDTDLEYVTPVPDQPEDSFYTVNGVAHFCDFVENLARQWSFIIV
ncbi:MAG: hypothetical protein AAFV80_11945 [Bacteroidota bacterium]